jgi:hypothetical protein
MQQRRAALMGVDVEKGRRERKNNIVNARANAREERLNNRRRLAQSDIDGIDANFAADSNQGGARSLEELPNNVCPHCIPVCLVSAPGRIVIYSTSSTLVVHEINLHLFTTHVLPDHKRHSNFFVQLRIF